MAIVEMCLLLIPLSLMVYFFLRRRKLVRSGIKATGIIIELTRSGDDIYPVIEFKTITGKSISRLYKVNQRETTRVGDKVELYYDPADPSSFIIDGKIEKWVPLIIMGVCILFLIIYLIFYI